MDDFINHIFDHPGRKEDKEHFYFLIQVANADGILDDSELKMLYRLGYKNGFTDPEIDSFIESAKKTSFVPPYELAKKFSHLYDIMLVILADGIIDKEEISFAKRYAIKSGFTDDDTDLILDLLITGIMNKVDEDEIFTTFKKKRMKK